MRRIGSRRGPKPSIGRWARSRAAIAAATDRVDRPLIRDFRDLDSQLQPNGFDLTLESVALHQGAGVVGQSNDGSRTARSRAARRSMRRLGRSRSPASTTLPTTRSSPCR